MLSKEDKLKILATQEDAAFELMSEPLGDDFFKGVQAVHAIRQLAEVVAYTDSLGDMVQAMTSPDEIPAKEPLPQTGTPGPELAEMLKAANAEEEHPVEEEPPFEMAEPEPAKEAEPELTEVFMRQWLGELNKAGAPVQKAINELGYAKFSLVPAADYAELYRRLKEAQ